MTTTDEPAHGRRHDRPAVRHRLAGGDAEALAARRDADDRRALVVRAELARAGRSRRASGTRSRSGPSPTITRGSPSVASRSSRMPFSGESRPTKRTCGGSSGSPTSSGIATTGSGSRARRARRARGPRRRGTRTRAIATPRAPQQRAREPGQRAARARRPCPRAARRTACRVASATSADGSQCACTRSASRAARRAARANATRNAGSSEHEPRPPAQVAGDAVPVRDPEVAERCRRDDLDLDAERAARPRRRRATKCPATSPGVARVRRRQDDDLHQAPGEHDRRREHEQREREEVVELHRQVEDVRGHRPDERGGQPPRERPHARRRGVARRGEPAPDPRSRAEPAEEVDEEGDEERARRRGPSRRAGRRRTSAARSSSGR